MDMLIKAYYLPVLIHIFNNIGEVTRSLVFLLLGHFYLFLWITQLIWIRQQLRHYAQFFETIRDERNTHANTAERIGNAFLSMLSYLSESPYLRKDQTDATQFAQAPWWC